MYVCTYYPFQIEYAWMISSSCEKKKLRNNSKLKRICKYALYLYGQTFFQDFSQKTKKKMSKLNSVYAKRKRPFSIPTYVIFVIS